MAARSSTDSVDRLAAPEIPSELAARLIENPPAPAIAELENLFRRFEESRLPSRLVGVADQPFCLLVDGEKGPLAGLKGNLYWDGLEVELLWVDPRIRARGIGSHLLRKAEVFAQQKGAGIAFLKTVEAREFYQRQGYTVFGLLQDRPLGSKLYHMKKRLFPE